MILNSNLSLLLLAILIANAFTQDPDVTMDDCYPTDLLEKYGNDNFLNVSCFLCLKPVCSPEETRNSGCKEWALMTKAIPLYANILEYGVMPMYLDGNITATVNFDSYCSVQISTIKFENNSFTSMVRIIEPGVHDYTEYQKLVDITTKTVVTFTILFDFDKTMRIHRSTDVEKLSTAFHDDDDFGYQKDTCSYDRYTLLTVDYKLTHSKTLGPDGSPKLISLPCSPGGYAAHAKTGKLVEDEDYIKAAFSDKAKLDAAVEKFYKNQKFEFYKQEEDTETRKPIYIDSNNQPLSMEEMNPKRNMTRPPTTTSTTKETTAEEAKAEKSSGPYVLPLLLASFCFFSMF